MGSFSWYASDTTRAIRSHNPFPVFLLSPDSFPLLEIDYDGYGEFDGKDVYELVANWNRKFLSDNPNFIIPKTGKKVSEYEWYELYANLKTTPKEIESSVRKLKYHSYFMYRNIGIDIACYNEDNFALPYPIKIVEKITSYNEAKASKSDPYQGFGSYDRFDGVPYKHKNDENWY